MEHQNIPRGFGAGLGGSIRECSLSTPFDGGGFITEDEIEFIGISWTHPAGFAALRA